jgi:hypothetical protein
MICTPKSGVNEAIRSIFCNGARFGPNDQIPWPATHHPTLEDSSIMAKAQDAKKETKKKPEKTLKEKRAEKQAKKASKT